MMDARFAAMEDRLLPERRIRLPLKGNDHRETGKQDKARKKDPVHKKPEVKETEKKEKKSTGLEGVRKPQQEGEWVLVLKKGQKKTKEDKGAALIGKEKKGRTADSKKNKEVTNGGKNVPRKATGAMAKSRVAATKPRKIKPPRSVAVILSLETPSGEDMEVVGEENASTSAKKSLGEILLETKGGISLEDLGIPSLRPRRAATGAMVYEIPGSESAVGADKLAAKLREALKGKGVKVSRPMKMEELREELTQVWTTQ